MVGSSNGVSEWVAFDNNVAGIEGGFETVVRASDKKKRPSKRGSASRRRKEHSSNSSWMDKPISGDASWAPVVPPQNVPAREHPTTNKRRPPRSNSATRQSSNASNPVSSSDSSSDDDPKNRGRASGKSNGKLSTRSRSTSKPRGRRGRSSSRTRTDMDLTDRRGRSTSRTRTQRERSTSVNRTRASNTHRGRAGSRPPTTVRSRSLSRQRITRSRSNSRTRPLKTGSKPPPSTFRTRREMRTAPVASSSSVGPGVPKRKSHDDGNASFRTMDDNIGRDISFGRTRSTKALTPTAAAARQRSGFMEKLFGDQVTEEARNSYMPRQTDPSTTDSVTDSMISWQQPEQIHSRILLTATVYHNTATNLWIATINTNQKGVAKNPATAAKYLKAFSFSSEVEARESAIANAPPKMLPFNDNPSCFICNGKFAMFRRAGHCRNCGVCVCNSCSTTWPSKMVPDTYNLKREGQVKICKSCNFLSNAFKKALLAGDYEEAVALYGSGNVNLRTPFPQSKKEEIMFPIHCAVEGGNIDIVRWLVEDHFCPIRVIRTSGGKNPKRGGIADQPILTSKNRSVMTIAMTSLQVDILQYLVVDNSVSIYEAKDLKSSLRALEAVLLALPAHGDRHHGDTVVHRWDDECYDGDTITSSLGDGTIGDGTVTTKGTKRNNSDSCILCCDNQINCVMTPCGHQVCCLECSRSLKVCPVCNMRGEFIKIFRP